MPGLKNAFDRDGHQTIILKMALSLDVSRTLRGLGNQTQALAFLGI